VWRFEFKTPFLCRNNSKKRFLRKTQRVSRNWLQKKCPQPIPPSKDGEGREEGCCKGGKNRRTKPKGYVARHGTPCFTKGSTHLEFASRPYLQARPGIRATQLIKAPRIRPWPMANQSLYPILTFA
jgi:hypothetical protein